MSQTIRLVTKLKDELSGPLDRAGKVIRRFAQITAAAMAAVTINSIRLAAQFSEIESKFKIVFGEAAPQARVALDAFADSIGRSGNRMLGFASTIQDTLVPIGYLREDAAKASVVAVKLATDMASFSDLDTAFVIQDIQSAIVGNYETMRKHGVVLSAAIVEQIALNENIWDGVGAITAQEKAAATLTGIIQGTSDAQGDAARTAGSLSNQVRSLGNIVYDLQVAFGEQLIPVISEFAEELLPLLKNAISDVSSVGGILAENFKLITLATTGLTIAIMANKAAVSTLGVTYISTGTAIATFRGAVVAIKTAIGVAGLAAAITFTSKKLIDLYNVANDASDALDATVISSKQADEALRLDTIAVKDLADALDEGTVPALLNLQAELENMQYFNPTYMLDQISDALSTMTTESYDAAIAQLMLAQSMLSLAQPGTLLGNMIDIQVQKLQELRAEITNVMTIEGKRIGVGTISDDAAEDTLEKLNTFKDRQIANLEEIQAMEEGAATRRDETEQAAIERRKQQVIATVEEQRAAEQTLTEERIRAEQRIKHIGISGMHEIGGIMKSNAEDWEEQVMLALARMALKAAAIKIGGPLGGVIGFIGGLFQGGGTVRHAQGGEQVAPGGIFGDRHPYWLETGEEVTKREQVIHERLEGKGRSSINLIVNYSPTLSTASPGEAVKLSSELIPLLKQAGADI